MSSLAQQIIDTCLKMNALGINQGTSGNVSVREGDHLLITPSGIAYEDTRPDDIVTLHMDGSFDGPIKPSSEWRFHRDIMAARPDINAIVHTHSRHATTLACLGQDLPPFHYMIAVAGGPSIRCAPYSVFGEQELSDHALAALKDRKACLLANHGLIVGAENLEKALYIAVEVETLCDMYLMALQNGGPNLLSEAQMAEVLEKFKTYGTQPAKGD